MASIFTQIIRGDISSFKIREDDQFFAFLDISPMARGHVLVIPKLEQDKAFDLPDEILGQWLVFSRPIAKAIEAAFPCNRCGVSIIGLEVPHAHMHLVPINNADDLNFTRPKLRLSQEELKEVQDAILSKL